MRRLVRTQTDDILRQMRMVSPGLGNLDEESHAIIEPDTDEEIVFNDKPVPGSTGVLTPGMPGYTGPGSMSFWNSNNFTGYPFNGPFFLNQNFRRTAILIQNNSAADSLVFNFGTQASAGNGIVLTAGQGILFDSVTPNNSLYISFLTSAAPAGFCVEGVYVDRPV